MVSQCGRIMIVRDQGGQRTTTELVISNVIRAPRGRRDARSACGDEKRANRATAFQGVCACALLCLLSLSIASSSGRVSSVLFGSGCFGAGRLAIKKSRKCFVDARRA